MKNGESRDIRFWSVSSGERVKSRRPSARHYRFDDNRASRASVLFSRLGIIKSLLVPARKSLIFDAFVACEV
jgi:hypothetical protein